MKNACTITIIFNFFHKLVDFLFVILFFGSVQGTSEMVNFFTGVVARLGPVEHLGLLAALALAFCAGVQLDLDLRLHHVYRVDGHPAERAGKGAARAV